MQKDKHMSLVLHPLDRLPQEIQLTRTHHLQLGIANPVSPAATVWATAIVAPASVPVSTRAAAVTHAVTHAITIPLCTGRRTPADGRPMPRR
jgi:hypothetical protein